MNKGSEGNEPIESQDPKDQRLKEITRVVSESHFSNRSARYSDNYKPMLILDERIGSPFAKEIEPFLQGNVLIDIGCGITPREIPKLASRMGVSKYVAVDPNVSPDKLPFSNDVSQMIKAEFHQTDGLSFLSRQPDNSANITINGIDYTIIDNAEYHTMLADEVARVIGTDHIVFGNTAPAVRARLRTTEEIKVSSIFKNSYQGAADKPFFVAKHI